MTSGAPPRVLVVAVSAVFDGGANACQPAEIASALLHNPEVITVRIGAHGQVSKYRVDIEAVPGQDAAERAIDIAHSVAEALDLGFEITSTELTWDDERPGNGPAA